MRERSLVLQAMEEPRRLALVVFVLENDCRTHCLNFSIVTSAENLSRDDPGDFFFFSSSDERNESLNFIKQIHRTQSERNMKTQFCIQFWEGKITSE